MMKNLRLILSLSALLQPLMLLAHLTDEGISQKLARQRAASLGDVRYEISLDIPLERTAVVGGEETIRFVADKSRMGDTLVIDFRNPAEMIHHVCVNGAARSNWTYAREHILIPAREVREGENAISIAFTAGDQSLNRREDYLYTLFVPDRARTVFPCFEQPDIKARFSLSLTIPEAWKAVSNSPVTAETVKADRRTMHFGQTEPLSTYLFAFAAGVFEYQEYTEDGRTIGAYYRETDPQRLAQLPTIYAQIMASLRWQEDFTAVKYPFSKYDIVVLPGFQFGGMEHTGCTFYNDNTLFLSAHPTPDEELRRAELIAHETTHMWFGDLVTMRWFDDVWTKEVFANYFAAAMTRPLFPDLNHDLIWTKTYVAAAMSQDRGLGGTAIQQPLDNMRNAGLVYNQIIYNKAPVMLKKLVELIGEKAFRAGVQEYVRTFAYANATWDELVTIMQRHTHHDLAQFSNVWVHEKGLPTIESHIADGKLHVRQYDAQGRGLIWPQRMTYAVETDGKYEYFDVAFDATHDSAVFELGNKGRKSHVLPNIDARGYGIFLPENNGEEDDDLHWLLRNWQKYEDETGRIALLSLLRENYLKRRISDEEWVTVITECIAQEKDALTAATLVGYLGTPLRLLDLAEQKGSAAYERAAAFRQKAEQRLWKLSQTHEISSCRIALLRLLATSGYSAPVVDSLYSIWRDRSNEMLSEYDYMWLAYQLSIFRPAEAETILSTQRQRLTNADRVRQFDFISRACTADETVLDSLAASLLIPENRRIEPWTATLISLLHHPLREDYSVRYIRPALDALADVQRTGDIFFPGDWCNSVLGSHISPAAYREVQNFLADNPDYLRLRLGKILNAVYLLERQNGNK